MNRSGQHYIYVQVWTTLYLCIGLDNIINMFRSIQHYIYVQVWTTLYLCLGLDNIISMFRSGQHYIYVQVWTTLYLCLVLDNIISMFRSGQHYNWDEKTERENMEYLLRSGYRTNIPESNIQIYLKNMYIRAPPPLPVFNMEIIVETVLIISDNLEKTLAYYFCDQTHLLLTNRFGEFSDKHIYFYTLQSINCFISLTMSTLFNALLRSCIFSKPLFIFIFFIQPYITR